MRMVISLPNEIFNYLRASPFILNRVLEKDLTSAF